MKQFLIIATLLVSLSLHTNSLKAQNTTPQTSPKSVQPTTPALPFDLDEFFNFDNFMQDLQTEMEATRSIWSQFLDPLLMDSMVNQLGDFDIGGSVDTIIQKFQLGIEQNGDMGIGNLLEQFMQGFDLDNFLTPNSTMPKSLDDIDTDDWKVVPQVPPATPQSQPVKPKTNDKNKTII